MIYNSTVHCVMEADEGHELPGWYFWNECGLAEGPFGTKEEAEEMEGFHIRSLEINPDA